MLLLVLVLIVLVVVPKLKLIVVLTLILIFERGRVTASVMTSTTSTTANTIIHSITTITVDFTMKRYRIRAFFVNFPFLRILVLAVVTVTELNYY